MLGGMARELDSEMLWRLQENYGEMSDGELLGLAAKPDDLTDFALEVLRGEMTRRGIRLDGTAAREEALPGASRNALTKPEFGTKLPHGRVVLMTFHDAIAAGDACDWLEGEGIEVDVRDVSDKSAGGGSFYGGPPVALEAIVPVGERARAVGILRGKMGLFPLQEVEESDAVVDDGTVAAVGFFGSRMEAAEVAKILEDAGIWHRIGENAEGSAEEQNEISLEVREVDLVRAGDVVERAMGLG